MFFFKGRHLDHANKGLTVALSAFMQLLLNSSKFSSELQLTCAHNHVIHILINSGYSMYNFLDFWEGMYHNYGDIVPFVSG